MLAGLLIGFIVGTLFNWIITHFAMRYVRKYLDSIEAKYHRLIEILQEWQKDIRKGL